MQIRIRTENGCTVIDVIDPSDGSVTHTRTVEEDGQQVVITAKTAATPADIEVFGPEAIPAAPTEAGGDGTDAGAGQASDGGEAPAPTDDTGDAGATPTGDAPAAGETPVEGDGSGEAPAAA